MAREVASGIWSIGGGAVNAYAIEDGDRLTLVDTGITGDWRRFARSLEELGRSPADVEAVLLTHAHRDHIGEAARFQQAGSTLHLHGDDHEFAQRGGLAFGPGVPNEGGFFFGGGALRMLWHIVVNVAVTRRVTIPGLDDLKPLTNGSGIDVPGSPVPYHTPGHTPGSAVFHLPERRILFTGDALITTDVVGGGAGPQLTHRAFNFDTEQARASLDVVEELDATLLLPGHGDPWEGDVREATSVARG